MRIAFFGGSFDPPHAGHIAIAEEAIRRLRLDAVMMAPVGVQPLKRHTPQTSFADRLAMVRLACEGHPRLQPSSLDAPRPDGRPNYTYETLRALREQLPPEDTLFFLVGGDSMLTLPKWHRALELLRLCEFIVAGRPGVAMEELLESLPEGCRLAQPADRGSETGEVLETRFTVRGEPEVRTLYLMPDLRYDISATAIREALSHEGPGAQGAEAALPVLTPAVARYAQTHGLYTGESGEGAGRLPQAGADPSARLG